MSKPLRRSVTRRVVGHRPSVHRVRNRWVPAASRVEFDLGSGQLIIHLTGSGTYPDTDVRGELELVLNFGGDIGIIQVVGPLLESRAHINPPSESSRI